MKLSFIWNISEGFPKPTVNVIDSEQKIPKQSWKYGWRNLTFILQNQGVTRFKRTLWIVYFARLLKNSRNWDARIYILAQFNKYAKFNTYIENSRHRKNDFKTCNINNLYKMCNDS